jgi:hypothetical protein
MGSTGVGIDMETGQFVTTQWTNSGPILIEWEPDDMSTQGIDSPSPS